MGNVIIWLVCATALVTTVVLCYKFIKLAREFKKVSGKNREAISVFKSSSSARRNG